MAEKAEKMNKKGEMGGDYPKSSFGKREITDINELLLEKSSSGKYKVESPIYRMSDDMVMARPGVEIRREKVEQLKEQIRDALKRKKSSPYYTDPL